MEPPSVKTSFGSFDGTGIYVKNGYLYASSDEEVFRYKLNANNEVENPKKPETVVTGLLNRHQHEAKAILLDDTGNLYVNIGAYSNSCQVKTAKKVRWVNQDALY
jgi:glucose/arabinose dehydrogenase